MRYLATIMGFYPIDAGLVVSLLESDSINIPIRYMLRNLAIAIVYLIAGRLGLALADIHTSVSAVWPPAGFAAAMVLLYGWSALPGILAGAFLVNFSILPDLSVASAIALGNTGSAALGGWLYERYKSSREFFTFKNLLILFANCAFVGPMVAASFGVGALVFFGYAAGAMSSDLWLQWWLGDAIGVLIATPFILAMFNTRRTWSREDVLPGVMVVLMTVVISLAIFVVFNISIAYLVVIPILLAGELFRRTGATTALVITAIISTYGTINGTGPFAALPILELQIFLGVSSMLTLLYFAGRNAWKS